MTILFRTHAVDGIGIFCRAASPRDASVILLLHDLPVAYRLIAPDLPGSGDTIAPPDARFGHGFDNQKGQVS